jgi:hypothetical protein
MHPRTSSARPIAAGLLALTALVAACTGYDPRNEPPVAPSPSAPRAASMAPASVAPAPASTEPSTTTPIGSTRVVLATSTGKAITVDVTDGSGSLTGAASGTPGDGASVEAYKLAVTNLSPTSLRLTWLGGPCDSANTLAIDTTGKQLLLVQPECPGDAIGSDRVLDLTFSAPIKAGEIQAFLQDGLDTPA